MTDKKKPRQMMYSEDELALIKANVADNDELLRIIQKVYFQTHLTDSEIAIVKGLNKDFIKTVQKAVLPYLTHTAPFGQNVDLWMTVEIKDKSPEEAVFIIETRRKLIELIEAGNERLSDPEVPTKFVIATYTPEKVMSEENVAFLVARNTLIGHVDMQLNTLKLLAGQKTESVEETLARLALDSGK